MEDQSIAMSFGVVNLKPTVFRVTRWVPDFNPAKQKLTNSQVWIRMLALPIEYWKSVNLFNIVRGTGLPLQISPKTPVCEKWVVCTSVDVDCSNVLPKKILVQLSL